MFGDTVGAGDSLMAGILTTLSERGDLAPGQLKGLGADELQEVLHFGAIVAGLAATFEMSATVRYERRYPATVNAAAETRHAIAAAEAVVGRDNVDTDPTPEMGSEDFAFMLEAMPGCYVWLGAGRGADTPNIHSPQYDFNDDALPIGASYWVALAEQQLAATLVMR